MTSRNFQKYGEAYLDLPFEPYLEEFRRRVVVDCVNKFGNAPRIRALEVGVGRMSSLANVKGLESVTIVEPMEWALASAKKDLEASKAEFFLGTLDDFFESQGDFYAGCFDLVLLSSVLHEMPDAAKCLNQVRCLLSRNGIVVIVVPNRSSIHRMVGLGRGIIESLKARTVTEESMEQRSAWDVQELSDLVRSRRYAVVDARTFFLKPLSNDQMESALRRGALSTKHLESLFDMSFAFGDLGAEIVLVAAHEGAGS